MQRNKAAFAFALTMALALVVAPGMGATGADAQVIGTFRWRMQPYCNVVTLTIEQRGASYLLTGADDNCGLTAPSTGVGVATQGIGASVALGFSTFTPSGIASHVSVTLSLASLSGPWTDDNGHSGQFAFNPVGSSGAPRPAPRSTVGTAQIDLGAVTPDRLSASVFAGTGTAVTAARSDHIHDDRYMTRTESQNTFAPLSALGPIGYSGTAWVNGDGSLSAQRATNGQAITVTRAGAGLYFVNFPGAFNGTFNQTIQLTDGAGFTGTSWRHCSVNLPQATGTTFIVAVSCVDTAFARADAGFFITVTS